MKTLEQRNELKAQFRSWKEELLLWNEKKPSFRHNSPSQYKELLSEWEETRKSIIQAMECCINEIKG